MKITWHANARFTAPGGTSLWPVSTFPPHLPHQYACQRTEPISSWQVNFTIIPDSKGQCRNCGVFGVDPLREEAPPGDFEARSDEGGISRRGGTSARLAKQVEAVKPPTETEWRSPYKKNFLVLEAKESSQYN